jgi:hypothetical protein
VRSRLSVSWRAADAVGAHLPLSFCIGSGAWSLRCNCSHHAGGHGMSARWPRLIHTCAPLTPACGPSDVALRQTQPRLQHERLAFPENDPARTRSCRLSSAGLCSRVSSSRPQNSRLRLSETLDNGVKRGTGTGDRLPPRKSKATSGERTDYPRPGSWYETWRLFGRSSGTRVGQGVFCLFSCRA